MDKWKKGDVVEFNRERYGGNLAVVVGWERDDMVKVKWISVPKEPPARRLARQWFEAHADCDIWVYPDQLKLIGKISSQ